MANDGKTMSDLFMSLMQGLDDDDEKKKRNLIPGTSIPMPDPNSLIPPVLDQFQTPPPKAPYQDAGDYMSAYREANKEAIDAIPRKDMLRADGSTKSAQGYLGAFPDKYGKMMTEQTIGVEIDGKEVQMPAIVPTTTPDEIELLGSGNVNWQSPRGQLIQDKAVANYRDRMSKGLNPYYQDGEGDVPPVQEVPKPAKFPRQESRPSIPGKPREVDTSALEAFRPDLIGKDPSSFIPKPTSAYDPVANREEVPPSDSKGLGHFIESSIASAGLPNTKTMRQKFMEELNEFGEIVTTPELLGAQVRMSLGLPVKALSEGYKELYDATAYVSEAVADPVLKFGQGFAGSDVTGVKQGDFGRYYPDKNTVPKVFSDTGSPVPEINTIPQVETKPTKETTQPKDVEGTPVVTTEETEASGKLIGSDTSKKVDKNLKVSGVQSGGKVVTKTNTETGEEEVEVVDEEGNEKPGFLKGLWNGIKDIAKEGFEDPSLRRALFAYTASRVLGYDGVTLASAVLENEWQKQAAQAKADLELEKAYGKAQAKLIVDKRVDPTKVFTVYDSQTKANLTGSTSKDGTLFYPDNPQAFGVEAGTPVDLSKLRTFDDGRFEPQAGKTMAELQGEYLEFAQDRAAAVIGQIKDRNSSMESKELDDLVAQMQTATDPNILSEPLMTFLSTLPAGADPTDKFVKEAAVNGIREWLKSFESGQTVGSKDLVGFLDAQRMKLDITSNGIPQAYFKIPADKKGEAQVGNNALSMIMNGIENSPYAKDLGLSTPIILSKMSDIYGKKVINEKGFQSRMNGYSKDSFSVGDKSKFVSPFFAFVEKSFASDNDDIAELMAELKK